MLAFPFSTLLVQILALYPSSQPATITIIHRLG